MPSRTGVGYDKGRPHAAKIKWKIYADGPRAVMGEHEYTWTKGPKESKRHHGWSTCCTKEQEYIGIPMETASAESSRKMMISQVSYLKVRAWKIWMVKACLEVWHVSTSKRSRGSQVMTSDFGSSSKPTLCRLIYRFGPQIEAGSGGTGRSWSRAHVDITKFAPKAAFLSMGLKKVSSCPCVGIYLNYRRRGISVMCQNHVCEEMVGWRGGTLPQSKP